MEGGPTPLAVGVVVPLQVDLCLSATASSTSLFDIFRGSEERRTANSCGPGTGGGMKEDPGEGKGCEGSGAGSDEQNSQAEKDIPVQLDILKTSRSCQSDRPVKFNQSQIRPLFDPVCIYTRHVLPNDARRSSDAARFSSDDIVLRLTPSHRAPGVGDAALFLRIRGFTVLAGTLFATLSP